MGLNCSKTQNPPLISAQARADSAVLLLSTQDFQSLTILQSLLYSSGISELMFNKAATEPEGKNTSLTMQLCSTSINQLLAQPYTHAATILLHQSAALIQGSLHSPRQHLAPQQTTARRNLPYPVIPCLPKSLLNHLCDLDSLPSFVQKVGAI